MRKLLSSCLRAVALLALVVIAMEAGSRLFWKFKYDVPLSRPGDIIYVFYPTVRTARLESHHPDPTHRDILVLGGSVLDEMRDGFEALSVRKAGNLRFEVAAQVAHTTLDSRRKYQMLENLPYDEVLIYDSINDCKYNNVPAKLFDDEYTAYPFYKLTSALLRHPEVNYVLLPYTLYFAWVDLRDIGKKEWQRPVVVARPKWVAYGSNIKSARTFRQNLEEIVRRAQQHGQTVHLATFASYIPQNYTEEKFRAGKLDYANPRLRVGVWGNATDVRACISRHNQIIREIAAEYSNVHLIEMESAIPREGRFFDDVCHFSPLGKERFFDALDAAL
jgi:hypothetical protein